MRPYAVSVYDRAGVFETRTFREFEEAAMWARWAQKYWGTKKVVQVENRDRSEAELVDGRMIAHDGLTEEEREELWRT